MRILGCMFLLSAACSAQGGVTPDARAAGGATPSVAVAPRALAKNPIVTAPVKKEHLGADLRLVGSVAHDPDRYAVVGPLVDGRVVKLHVGVGDTVRAGQILAEIESADVGQAQAAYLSARARGRAADANLARETDLTAQRISSVREREVAEAQALQERAELRAATERLRAFGLGDRELKALDAGEVMGGRIPLRAPIGGVVVERLVSLGQAVQKADDAFKIVDIAHLWVLLDLYEKDLPKVHVGQAVELRTEARPGEVFHGVLGWVSPLIDDKTRTAQARVQLDNAHGKLSPGQFVTARIVGDSKLAPVEALAVPRRAVQSVEGRSVVFVRSGERFERRVVELGPSNGELVAVRSGVAEGEEVATDGAFLLKSELLR